MENIDSGKGFGRLGFGLMRLPMNGAEVDIAQVGEMVDLFIEKGFDWFDTSPVYVGGKSEGVAAEVLVGRYPREKFRLATKLPLWLVENGADMERFFEGSLAALKVDYVDFYLLHGLRGTVSDRFPSSDVEKAEALDAWGFLRRKKDEGKIRHIGFSFHDSAEVLDRLLTEHPEAEFVQLQVNYADWEDETLQARRCYETARRHGKPVVVMEPVKGGTLANLRPEAAKILKEADPEASPASWALRYAASLEGVVTVLSGMSDVAQMRDNVGFMENFRPVDGGEIAALEKVVELLHDVESIGCTRCGYCLEGCPQGVRIPTVFDVVNDYRVYGNAAYSKRLYGYALKDGGKASACVACGTCESRCPQKLEIIRHLREAAELFER